MTPSYALFWRFSPLSLEDSFSWEILRQIGQRQNTRGHEIGYNVQWEDRDFEPISIEMEKVFKELGWLRGLRKKRK